MNQDEIICYCRQTTRAEIEEAIRNGARTLADIQQATGACTLGNCKEMHPEKRCCAKEIRAILEENPV